MSTTTNHHQPPPQTTTTNPEGDHIMLYICTDIDRTAIYGLGHTPDEAIADAVSQCRDLTDLVAVPCSNGLYAQVEREGGAIAWHETEGMAERRAVTVAEAEAGGLV